MPDATGKMSSEEKQKCISWLTSKGKPPACPFCGSVNWIVADHVVQPINHGVNGALQLGGPGYPQIMLISDKCGYTTYFNAVMMGLLPGPAADVPGEQKK